jgi:hypothetical protein
VLTTGGSKTLKKGTSPTRLTNCKIHATLDTTVIGSTTAAEGNCHIVPRAPVNSEGACVATAGTAIALSAVSASSATTVAACKLACEAKGT